MAEATREPIIGVIVAWKGGNDDTKVQAMLSEDYAEYEHPDLEPVEGQQRCPFFME